MNTCIENQQYIYKALNTCMYCEPTMSQRKNLNIKKTTYSDLKEFKSPGQSFDGAILELLKIVQRKAEVYEA